MGPAISRTSRREMPTGGLAAGCCRRTGIQISNSGVRPHAPLTFWSAGAWVELIPYAARPFRRVVVGGHRRHHLVADAEGRPAGHRRWPRLTHRAAYVVDEEKFRSPGCPGHRAPLSPWVRPWSKCLLAAWHPSWHQMQSSGVSVGYARASRVTKHAGSDCGPSVGTAS